VIKYINETQQEMFTKSKKGLDKFTKTAFILMLLILAVVSTGAYLGYLNGKSMAGIDGIVETSAAPDAVSYGIGIKLVERFGEPLVLLLWELQEVSLLDISGTPGGNDAPVAWSRPMNGIVITISFFVSLIIGRFFREHFQLNSKIIDTRIKILVSFLLIISVTLMKHWYLPVIISFFCMIIALNSGYL